MSLLRYYENKEPREESLAEVYYSSTFEVTSYMKHSIGCGVEPRIKIQRVSHNSQPSNCESFIIRYGEVLYAIIEIGIDNTRYESSEVYLFDLLSLHRLNVEVQFQEASSRRMLFSDLKKY